MSGRTATPNPLDEIRRVEQSGVRAVEEARAGADAAGRDARARAGELVRRAADRGSAAAQHRYEEGMRLARDEAARLLEGVDDRVAELRALTAPQLDTAVEAVVAFITPEPGGG